MTKFLDQLRASGAVDEQALQAALRRQQIYGGSLDTVLLELDHIDPPTLSKLLAAANDCGEVPVGVLEPGPERPWNALPKSLLDLGWAMPLRRHMGSIQVAIHPEIPVEQRQQLEHAVDHLQIFVTCEACLAKLAAERRASVMPQRYAVLALKWIQALEREQPEPEPATPAAPWMTASPDTAPYTIPPPEAEPEPAPPPAQPPAPAPAATTAPAATERGEPEPGEPEPVARSSTFLYGLPVEDDDDETSLPPVVDDDEDSLPPVVDDDEDSLPPIVDDDVPMPRPLSNRGAEIRPSASLETRLAEARATLEAATTRDETTAALARAAMVVSPRAALFGIKREGLRGLDSPGEISEAVDQLVEFSPKLEAAVDGSAPLERVTDLDLRIALGQEMAVPCVFLPVAVHDRPVLMLYLDRGGEPFDDDERAAVAALCETAGQTLEGVLLRMREGTAAPTPAPAPAPAPAASPPAPSAPGPTKPSIFSAPSSLVPPGLLQGAAPASARPASARPAPPAPTPPAPTPAPPAPTPAPPAPTPAPPAPTAPPVRVAPPRQPAPSSQPSVSFSAPGNDKPPVRVQPTPQPPPVRVQPTPQAPPVRAQPTPQPPVRAQPTPQPPAGPSVEALSPPLGNSRKAPPSRDGGSIRGRIQLDDEDRPAKPSVELQAIDAAIQAAMRGDSSAAQHLREIGEPAMLRVAKQFPGELDVHRRDLDTLPPLPAHGALIRVALELGPALAPHLVELIEHPNPTVRFYLAFVFMELRHELAIGALGKLAFDPDADVRAIAMRVLETYSGEEWGEGGGETSFEAAIKVIRHELASPNRTRQLHSTRAVGTVRDIAAVPKLIDLLASKERYIQEASLESLCSITGQQLGLKPHRWRDWYEANAHHHRVEWIISSLAHKDLSVRRWAADELRRITGQRIHFLAAGTKQEREIGIRKWVDWWTTRGRQEFGAD